MNRVETIRAAIVAKLAAVPNVGMTHDHEPYAKDLRALQALYAYPIDGGQQLRGWFVQRVATPEMSLAIGRNWRDVKWRIRGYMALAEEAGTELAFDALIEALCDAVRGDETLGGVCASTVTDQAAGLQLVNAGPVMFAGVLCHAAELSLTTRYYL